MRLLIILAALLCVASARAQNRLVSINAFELGYTGGLVFRHDNGKDRKDRDSNQFKLSLNYAQRWDQLGENFMWRVAGLIDRNEVDQGPKTKNSIWGLAGGLLYNFDASDIKNSAFAGANLGLEWQTIDDVADDETGINITVSAEGGKRWDMGRYASAMISYAPTVEVLYRRYGGDIRDTFYTNGTELKLNFLKFDVMF